MLTFRKETASKLEGAVKSLFPEATLTASELCDMLETPPDAAMGDLALPCFKLSRSIEGSFSASRTLM